MLRKFAIICALMAVMTMTAERGHGQPVSSTVHPTAADISRALSTVDIMFTRMHDPLGTIAPSLSRTEVARGQQEMTSKIATLCRQWSAILTVSGGKEMPSASDLFMIYTQLTDINEYVDTTLIEDRLKSQPVKVINAATILIRSRSELLYVTETLRYAVSDRIDFEEAALAKKQK